MPADQTFSNEPAPAESHHGETAQQFDSTPPSEQWNTQPPPQEPPLTPTTTAPDQPAAEPPPKRSWLLPILGLVFMLAVIGIVPWMIIKLIHKTPTEHVAKDKTEPTNNSDQNKPNDRPKTPEEALRLWSEIEAHQRAFPRGYEKRAQLLRDYIASFPDTPQAAIAQKRLDEIAPWLKSKADQLFEKTMADIYTALTKREYAAALKLAQDAANNAELKDQKPWLELAANAASRLKNFWDALPAAINATKGRAVTLQGISGVIAGATAERVQLELRLGASSSLMEIPLQRLSPQEIADLARAAQPRYDAETRQNYAWFYFAGGMERESSIMFDLAEKAGADIAAGRVLAAMLAKGVEEYAAERELLQLRAALENRQWKHGAELFEQLRQRHSETKTLQAAAEELAAIEGLLAFEVEVLQAAVGAALRSLAGHTAAALAVACSLDGKTAVSVSADGTAKIWDLRAGRLLHTLHGHNGEVRAVAVSPTADYAITGGADRTVRFWNLATGETMAVYAEHTAEINAVAFSHDGNRIASTGADRIIKVLRPPLGVEIRGVKISGETPMRSLALNRDGRFAAAGGDDRNVRQWDLTTGKERRKLQGHTAAVTCIALTADGNIAFSGSEDGTVKQWDFNASTSLRTWRAHEGKVAAIALSADGRFVATAGADGVAKIWEAATGRELRALRGHHGAVLGVALTGDSRFAVTAGEDATVKVWKLWDTDPFGVPILP
jgi:hypothetical protein